MPTEIVLSHAQPEIVPARLAFDPDDMLAHFLSNLGERTRREYEASLRDFARFLAGYSQTIADFIQGGPGPANMAVLQYMTSLTKERGLKSATVAARIAAIRSFLRGCRLARRIDWTVDIRPPAVEAYRDTRGPSPDEYAQMVRYARTLAERPDPAPSDVRNLAMVLILRGNALRRFELTGLDLAHVEPGGDDGARIWILGKKRTDREVVSVSLKPTVALRDWIKVRGEDRPGPLFTRLDPGWTPGGDLQRLTGRSLGRIIPDMAKRAGLTRRVKPHGLRHSGINAAREHCKDIYELQAFSRHKSSSALQHYVRNADDVAGKIARLIDRY